MDDLASIRMRSPIFNPSECMVTSSTAGEAALEDPLERETVEMGDLVPGRRSGQIFVRLNVR